MIKKIKSALNQEKYENCKRQKLCNTVKFELVNPRNIPKHDGTTTKTTKKPSFINPTTPQIEINEETVSIQIFFESFIVEVIKDSYTYTFINIFSEVGGALGILAGLSCMTVIEFLTSIFKSMPAYCHGVKQKFCCCTEI